MAGPHRTVAFAPGRVNLIGEHTDYNAGLALPLAVSAGVTVTAAVGAADTGAASPLLDAVRTVLEQRGWTVPPARITVASDLPAGMGLSSSAALGVASVLALTELSRSVGGAAAGEPLEALGPVEIARIVQAAEHAAGTECGLLDPLASLLGRPGTAWLIDFGSLRWEPVALDLGGGRLALFDSGERRDLARSGYNDRRAECRAGHPDRLAHVAGENERVRAFVAAMGDPAALGRLLDASHASLRDRYEVSTPAVEATVARAHAAGALGARIMGGGFGGSVLALFGPDTELPADAVAVNSGRGARLIESVAA